MSLEILKEFSTVLCDKKININHSNLKICFYKEIDIN